MQKLSLVVLALVFFGCDSPQPPAPALGEDIPVDAAGNTAPTAFTAQANAELANVLPLGDRQDFADARTLAHIESGGRLPESGSRCLSTAFAAVTMRLDSTTYETRGHV